jgi:hypothetical protein
VEQSTHPENDPADINIREGENKQFEIEFKEDYAGYRLRKLALETNKSKAYAFLWEHCTKGMKNKIES